MERNTGGVNRETISRKDRLSPEMAFVAIIDTETHARVEPFDWRKEGACTTSDAETFYPGVGEGVKAAKAICARCPENVKEACLEDALTKKEAYGVRGGLTVGQRGRLLTKRQHDDTAA